MQSILEEFAYGNLRLKPQSFEQNPIYCEAVKFARINEKRLLAKLNEDEKDTFQKFIDAQNDVTQQTAIECLVRGYKLGVLITAEAFVTSEDLTTLI